MIYRLTKLCRTMCEIRSQVRSNESLLTFCATLLLDLITIGNVLVARVRRWNGARSSGVKLPSVAAKTPPQGKFLNEDSDEKHESHGLSAFFFVVLGLVLCVLVSFCREPVPTRGKPWLAVRCAGSQLAGHWRFKASHLISSFSFSFFIFSFFQLFSLFVVFSCDPT